MNALLEARDLVKVFGSITAVDGISFAVDRGEVMGFLGPNGAGKSTTMKMLTGFLRPTRGSALIAGLDVASHGIAARERLGYLPEGAPLYGEMTAMEFLRFVAAARGLGRSAARTAIDDVIGACHIATVAHQPIETLSKGFKRRVGLAQALLHDPDVLVLDEPTDGLDPNQKHEVRRLIRSMAPDKAIIISTHILEEVEALCSRVLVIDRGRVVSDGTPLALRRQSRFHNVVTLDLGAALGVHRGSVDQGADAAGNAIRQKLMAIEGVADVRVERAATLVVTVQPRDGKSIIEAVLKTVHANNWPLVDVSVDRGQMDDVFRTLTTGDAPDQFPDRRPQANSREGQMS